MFAEKIYELALSQVPHIGHVHAKTLNDQFGSASAIFHATQQQLERIEGIGTVRAKSILSFKDFSSAEREWEFANKYGISVLYLSDANYPRRLLNCYDPPTVLFYKGTVSLNASRCVAIVGTRNNTEYGKTFTEKLVKKLATCDCIIISGLAFGIDAIAHKCAVKYDIPTIGVVGHGLDTIYPPEHAGLARQLLKNGGLLTEFKSKTKPDKHNFPSRNRVVAGICDATIIVESGIKGGSMITAEIADSYHRDVFAVPGRATDAKSSGCNELIKRNRATLLMDPEQLIETMGWADTEQNKKAIQKQLFPDLNSDEKIVVELLKQQEVMTIDELNFKSGITHSNLAGTLLNLELSGVLKLLPGKRYTLADV
jgi:DNA processing protein